MTTPMQCNIKYFYPFNEISICIKYVSDPSSTADANHNKFRIDFQASYQQFEERGWLTFVEGVDDSLPVSRYSSGKELVAPEGHYSLNEVRDTHEFRLLLFCCLIRFISARTLWDFPLRSRPRLKGFSNDAVTSSLAAPKKLRAFSFFISEKKASKERQG